MNRVIELSANIASKTRPTYECPRIGLHGFIEGSINVCMDGAGYAELSTHSPYVMAAVWAKISNPPVHLLSKSLCADKTTQQCTATMDITYPHKA